jgi:hypothetical protein
MATSSTVLSLTGSGAQPQSGAAAGETASWTLAPLEQPRFFYGQLLTDQDLNALLAWAQGRLRLARHHAGWGVVCGLELYRDPKQDGRVIVGPGLAVDACGDTIVVPAPSEPLDLSEACVQTPVDCAMVARAADDKDRPQVSIGGISYFADELRYVDVFVRLKEAGTSPQTALGRRVSGQAEVCEYSRTREDYALDRSVTCLEGSPLPDPTVWHHGYSAIWDGLRALKETLAAERAGKLLAAIGANEAGPLRTFPLINDLIATADDAGARMSDAAFFLALFFLVQDRHNAYLADHRRCTPVQGDRGVRLGRVRAQVRSTNGLRTCHILDIDPAPPFRREFGPDGLPAPLGQLNLGLLLWRRAEEAQAFLAERGIQATFVRRPFPASAGSLAELFDGTGVTTPLFVAPGDAVTVYTVAAYEQAQSGLSYLGERVVALARTPNERDQEAAQRTEPAKEVLAEIMPEPEPEAPKAQLAPPRRRRS